MVDRSTARGLVIATRGLVFALTALALAACGGASTKTTGASGSGSEPGATVTRRQSPATHREFVARAADICESAGAQAKPLKAREEALKGQPVASATPAFAALVRQGATIARGAYERLRALPKPPADASAIQQLLQSYAEETNDAADIANAAAHKENSLGEAISQALSRLISERLAVAKSFGMGDCFQLE
jgi:hypothetical protein